VVDVLEEPAYQATSASSGEPIAIGKTNDGHRLVVVYQSLEAVSVSVITAFDPD